MAWPMPWKVVLVGLTALACGCKFPYPEDVPDDVVDGAPTDAHVRTQPLVTNHQAADLVIGARDFVTQTDPNRPIDEHYIGTPESISGRGNRLWVADLTANQVSLFKPLPSDNDPAATMALAPGEATCLASAPSPSKVCQPSSVIDTGSKLLVADYARNRVLIWSTLPSQSTTPADLVLGQLDFVSSGNGSGPGQLAGPRDVWSDGTRVVVSDAFNYRVLIWLTFPVRNGQPADLVLGQRAIDQAVAPASPSSANIGSPDGIASNGTLLAIADREYQRILIWNTFPQSSGTPASVVLGQDRSDVSVAHSRGDPRGILPLKLAVFDGALFVADALNQRVLAIDPIPVQTLGDLRSTSQALGQVSPDVTELDATISDRTVIPGGLAVVDNELFVGDRNGPRVLRYSMSN